MYSVYILRCSDNSLYTGISNDPVKRLALHNNGKGSKYVKSRLPATIVYTESYGSRGEALKREYNIKQLSKCEKEELVRGE